MTTLQNGGDNITMSHASQAIQGGQLDLVYEVKNKLHGLAFVRWLGRGGVGIWNIYLGVKVNK
jgi:hypothetical protein